MVLPTSILLPLYIFPNARAWDPLYTALKTYPNITFNIVINISDGPGSTQPTEYVNGIQTLHNYPNAHLLGYLHARESPTSPELADLPEIIANITKYAAWGKPSSNNKYRDIHMHGLFIDEAPWKYDDESWELMESIANSARQNNFHPLIFNAGASADKRYFDLADQVVMFENSQDAFSTGGPTALDQIETSLRQDSAVLIHDWKGSKESMAELVRGVVGKGFGGLLVSADCCWRSWGAGTAWLDFVAAVSSH